METIDLTDVLVAVADRNVTAALLMADELYRAGCASARAEQAYEAAQADLGCSSRRIKMLKEARGRAGDRVTELSAGFEALMAGADDGLYVRVETTVWRDRVAEYAHARKVSEKEKNQR